MNAGCCGGGVLRCLGCCDFHKRGCREREGLIEQGHVLFIRGRSLGVTLALMFGDGHCSPAEICGSGII